MMNMNTFAKPYLDATKQLCIKAITRLMEINYYSARGFYKYLLHRSNRRFNNPPLLIYQMGKVGSQTIERSLRPIKLDMAVYHTHVLTKERIADTEAKRKKFFRTERYSYLKRPWLNQFLRKQIDRGLNEKKWKIITLTREPISRNISTFFENLEVKRIDSSDKYEVKSDYYDIAPIIVTPDNMQALRDLFFDRLNHDSPLVFFDRELKGVFGIDVFASEFPKSKGFKTYEDEKADVLLIRLENLNDCAEEAFKDFLDIHNFALVNTNIGREKVYASIYNKFRETIHLPDSYLDKFYNSKYMRHFYTEAEIEKFRAKWCRSST